MEHNQDTILLHLSDEGAEGWLVVAVDRKTRRWAVAVGRRQLDAATDAFEQLYSNSDDESV